MEDRPRAGHRQLHPGRLMPGIHQSHIDPRLYLLHRLHLHFDPHDRFRLQEDSDRIRAVKSPLK